VNVLVRLVPLDVQPPESVFRQRKQLLVLGYALSFRVEEAMQRPAYWRINSLRRLMRCSSFLRGHRAQRVEAHPPDDRVVAFGADLTRFILRLSLLMCFQGPPSRRSYRSQLRYSGASVLSRNKRAYSTPFSRVSTTYSVI